MSTLNVLEKKELIEALSSESKELAAFFAANLGEGVFVYFSESAFGQGEIGEANKEIYFDIYNLLGSPVYEVENEKIAIQIDGEIGKDNYTLAYFNRETKESFIIIALKN
jgi:hypothetical protein